MPRKKNLDLASELGEEVDVTEEQANDANTIVAPEPIPVPTAPAQPITMSVADIQAIVQTAISASQQGNTNLADMVTQGIAQARKPIPEGTDASNPRKSDQNPLGDRDHPRPLLKCEYFIGTKEPKSGQIARTYPFLDGDLTVSEVIALNTLQAGNYVVKLHDGSPIKVSVVPELDQATDELNRLVIVVPGHVIEKMSQIKNMLPDPCNLVAQITGHDYRKLSLDDLAWFMAEHRAQRYVSERESVAA